MPGDSTVDTLGRPDTPTEAPGVVQVRDEDLDDLQCLLSGAYPVRRYLTHVEAQAAALTGRLPDGTWCPLPLRLRVPGPAPRAGATVALLDAEGTPVAHLRVTETEAVPPTGGGEAPEAILAGPVTAGRPPGRRPLQHLHAAPAEAPAAGRLAVVTDRPPTLREVATAREEARRRGTGVAWLGLVGAGSPVHVGPEELLQALLLTASPGEPVIAVPLPAHPELSPGARAAVEQDVASRYGAGDVALLTAAVRARPASTVPGPRGRRVPVPTDDVLDAVVAALDAGRVPAPAVPAGVLDVLAARHPGPGRRGGVVLLTGLSGSGKSTVAGVLRDALVGAGRSVTLLDGDEVRRLLSSGLGFSREDRDLNVRRIGYVAAEVARHGGIAVAAPIAPYAAGRADVRRRVTAAGGDFVLVHVATPLQECERRDRKGLYAAARSGALTGFTGISDPYEVPVDADLVLDTTGHTPDESAAQVLAALDRRGWVPRRPKED